MLALALAAALPAAEARPADRCSGAPWYVATAHLDEATLPDGVALISGGSLPRLSNATSTPYDLVDASLVPTDRLVDGQAFHWFATGVPVEGMQHLTGWQNPYGMTSALLNVPPAKAASSGPGRPADATAPSPEPFVVQTLFGGNPTVLRGEWQFTLDPGYDSALCAKP